MQCPHCGDVKEFWVEAWASLLFTAKDGFVWKNTDLVCPACGKKTIIENGDDNAD